MDSPNVNILALSAGFELGGYRIEHVLGAGGFGITYLARDAASGRKVAIKEFLPTGIATRGSDRLTVRPITGENEDMFRWGIDRFKQEADTLLAFEHPNVVRIERFFEANGTAYLVMSYIEGKSLGAVLRELGTIENVEIMEIILPLLDGLAHVHEKGFLHRDIKPDNIFISTDGRPILIDFGAARQALSQQSKSLTAIVSEGYAPYEQYEAHGNQGPWTDIYAMGAVIYRCMTGERPVAAPSRISARFRGRPDPLIPLAQAAKGLYAPALVAMAERALAVGEDERPQSIPELLALLPPRERPALAGPNEAPTGLSGATFILAGGRGDASAVAHTLSAGQQPPLDGESTRDVEPASPSVVSAPPRRRRVPVAALTGGLLGAVLLAGGAAAWIGGAFGPGTGEGVEAASGRQEAAARDAEAEGRRAEEQRKREEEAAAKRKADEEAARAEAERRRQEEARKRAEDDARKAEEERKRQAEADQKKAEEERQRAEAERKKAEEDRKRQEEADAEAARKREAEAEAERKRQAEEADRARAETLKAALDRAGAASRQARAHLAAERFFEARRAADRAKEAADEAAKADPDSADAKRAVADAAALQQEVRGQISAHVREQVEAARRDIAAGRAADAARKIAEVERLEPVTPELASLKSDLAGLRARIDQATRARRDEELRRQDAERRRAAEAARRAEAERRRAEAERRSRQPPAAPDPPARAPARPILIPP